MNKKQLIVAWILGSILLVLINLSWYKEVGFGIFDLIVTIIEGSIVGFIGYLIFKMGHIIFHSRRKKQLIVAWMIGIIISIISIINSPAKRAVRMIPKPSLYLVPIHWNDILLVIVIPIVILGSLVIYTFKRELQQKKGWITMICTIMGIAFLLFVVLLGIKR